MAAAVWQRRQAAAAGQGRPWVINQRIARAFVRVRRPGALTFAAISEVGVGGRRVEIGHGFLSCSYVHKLPSLYAYKRKAQSGQRRDVCRFTFATSSHVANASL